MKTGIYENLYKAQYQCVGIYMYFCTKYMNLNREFFSKTKKIKV